jgi:hypothetical protein
VTKLTIHWPDAHQERVQAAKGRLEVARAGLVRRTTEEVLAPLCAVLEQWRDPDSKWRRAVLAELPDAAGLSHETVARGLTLALSGWRGEALRELVARELTPQLGDTSTHLAPFESTSVLLAGSIPSPTLLQCLLPLILRAPVLARTTSRDPVTARLVAASIAEVDDELGRCIEVIEFPSDDHPAMGSVLEAPCVVVSGSDDTIRDVAERVGPSQRLVAYGHKLSIAVVGHEATRGESLRRLVEGLSLDVGLWDQLGCLSAVSVYVVDDEPYAAADRVAGELFSALATLEREMPRGPLAAVTAAAIARERSEAEMRAAAGQDLVVHASAGTLYTVVREADLRWRPSPLHRFVRVYGAANLAELVGALAPLSPVLSAAAVAGFSDEGDEPTSTSVVAKTLADLGASRICAPGRLQAPPLDWRHDGRPILLPLARFVDFESA